MRKKRKLYNRDALEVMLGFPDNVIDLIVTDPPFDTMDIDAEWPLLWEVMQRVSRNQIVFHANYAWNSFRPADCFITSIPETGPPILAWTSFKRMPLVYRLAKNVGVDYLALKNIVVMPPELATLTLRDFANREDYIFDPFAGTGTTLIAAARFGLRCGGCEIDPDRFRYILNRFKQMQLPELAV